MMPQEPVKRVELVIEALVLNQALAIIEQAGAPGYTVVPHVYGKGHRGVRTDLGFSDVLRNVMVIVVAREQVARRIARELGELLENNAGILTMTPVEICSGSHI